MIVLKSGDVKELIKDTNGNNLIQYGGKERFKAGEGPLFKYKYNPL